MEINQPKVNREKPDAILFLTAKQRVDSPVEISLTIAGHRVLPKSSVRNLGVLFDRELTMEALVEHITKLSYKLYGGKFGQV